jgi:hypothetical protein|tara:strand:- start:303 stop:521 length:219 start_codon:yes stop_codon:yes gene_type:complete
MDTPLELADLDYLCDGISVPDDALPITLSLYPAIAPYQVWLALILVMALAIPSTYLIEKPFVKFIRSKYLDK